MPKSFLVRKYQRKLVEHEQPVVLTKDTEVIDNDGPLDFRISAKISKDDIDTENDRCDEDFDEVDGDVSAKRLKHSDETSTGLDNESSEAKVPRVTDGKYMQNLF